MWYFVSVDGIFVFALYHIFGGDHNVAVWARIEDRSFGMFHERCDVPDTFVRRIDVSNF